jgi:hypothetical protein
MDKNHTDILKGIAIILVLISHLGGVYGTRYLTPLGGIGVAIFLITSGYGLSKSFQIKGLIGYWKNKFIKVFLTYYLVRLGYIFLTLDITFKELLLDFLFIKPLHPFGWYMNYLFIMYVLFYVVQRIRVTQKIRNFTYLFIALVLFLIMPEIKAEQSLSFFIGVWYAFNSEKIDLKLLDKTILLGVLFSIISFSALILKQFSIIRNANSVIFNFDQLLIKLFGALALVLLIYSFRNLIKLLNLTLFSSFSYEIYLVHGYTISLVESPTVLSIFLFFVLTIILSFILKKVTKFFQVHIRNLPRLKGAM